MTLQTQYRSILLLLFFTLSFSISTFCQEVHTIEKIVYQRDLISPKSSVRSLSLSYKYQADKKVGIIARRKTGITKKEMYTAPFEHQGVYKYYYDENGKVVRIKSPFLERKLEYDRTGKLKTLLFKGKAGRDKFLTSNRWEFTYDENGRVVKLSIQKGETVKSEHSFQYHREKNLVKRIVTQDGKIKSIVEVHLKASPRVFNLDWYELIDPSDHRLELFTDLMFGFPSHVVCLSENSRCDQQFTYNWEDNQVSMKHEWENNIDGKISNHHRVVVFHFME